jgi:hypothetical protein
MLKLFIKLRIITLPSVEQISSKRDNEHHHRPKQALESDAALSMAMPIE